MIKVTRINKVDQFWINEEKIEFIEEAGDTILSLESGKKVAVAESAGEVMEQIDERRRKLLGNMS